MTIGQWASSGPLTCCEGAWVAMAGGPPTGGGGAQ
jgi:hypothetical protein